MAANVIRLFAIMLAFTGFSASTYTTPANVRGAGTVTSADDGVTGTPVALCNPNDPKGCGLD